MVNLFLKLMFHPLTASSRTRRDKKFKPQVYKSHKKNTFFILITTLSPFINLKTSHIIINSTFLN
ncbi:MAG: hypothetical protein CMM43_08865 [Rhodospirillaceae bacterium]|nr:hypothetical protein [Rhodospirillaceae bacterium]